MNINAPFQWECQPKAEKIILDHLNRALQASSTLFKFEETLLHQTNTRLFDWIDYIVVEMNDQILKQLKEAGFISQENGHQQVFFHPGAQLPRIMLQASKDIKIGVALAVDSIADFLMVRGEHHLIEGSIFGNFRRCLIFIENGVALWVIEKRGTLALHPTEEKAELIYRYLQALEKWKNRPRFISNEDEAMQKTLQLGQRLVEEVGQPRAAWTVLEGERQYWQARNLAGQIQKNRQDQLGMGWANHDHHTFRSSRRHFNPLVHLFELLGFHCRERFYAGEEAGWGAQVMENPVCRLVLFLDVDLTPNEIAQDFAHQPLPEVDKLGTIGLWCALHGDSILQAGMHHLEAQFMFEDLKEGLASRGIKMMNPFSSFPYLKQAFTEGERWPVDPERIRLLVSQGKISPEEGEKFLTRGALGSHLENLQRREGYKGFNRNSVSIIIKKTDPRL